MEIVHLGIEEEKKKTIKLDYETWKLLSQYKLDSDKQTFDEAIKELLENAGY